MCICKNLDGFVSLQSVFHVGLSVSAKYNYIVSRSVSECNTTIYCSDINWNFLSCISCRTQCIS